MHMWRLNDTLLKNQWVNEESKRELKNTFWQMKMEIKHTKVYEKVKVLVTQSCLILCNPINCNQPGSSVHGILQARKLEWVAIPFSRASSQPRNQTWNSCNSRSPVVRFFNNRATKEAHQNLWDIAIVVLRRNF